LSYSSILIKLSFIEFPQGIMVNTGADLLIYNTIDVSLDNLYIFMEDFRFYIVDCFYQADFLRAYYLVYLLIQSQNY